MAARRFGAQSRKHDIQKEFFFQSESARLNKPSAEAKMETYSVGCLFLLNIALVKGAMFFSQ